MKFEKIKKTEKCYNVIIINDDLSEKFVIKKELIHIYSFNSESEMVLASKCELDAKWYDNNEYEKWVPIPKKIKAITI